MEGDSMKCRKCGSEKSVKNGRHLGRQRYKCKDCGFQFTQEQPKGKDLETKCLAIILYVNGLSFRAIAKIVKVSHKAVHDWVKSFGLETYEKPKPQGEIVIELDEMWHFLHSKKTNTGYGKHIVALQVNSSTGKVEGVTVAP
jgi:transposase-like protein